MVLEFEIEEQLIQNLCVHQAIKQLPGRYRAIICLSLAGYTQREIGQILGVTQSAISFIYRKAIKRLKETLGEN